MVGYQGVDDDGIEEGETEIRYDCSYRLPQLCSKPGGNVTFGWALLLAPFIDDHLYSHVATQSAA